jgi:hypothetical protein
MPARSGRKRKQLVMKSAEMALAVPQVMTHRIARMAAAGFNPSARDRNEFRRMHAEKTAAFIESWNAMAMQAARTHRALALAWFRACSSPWSGRPWSATGTSSRWHRAALDVAASGFHPVHRRVMANAKRLGRSGGR